MGSIGKLIKGVIGLAWEVIGSMIETIWDNIVEPIMKEVMGVFGITDQLVIQVSKVSIKLYGQNVEKPSKNAITKAVIGKAKDTNLKHSYFDHYWYQINQTKVNVTTFYRFALSGQYVFGLPDATIHGTQIDEVAVQNAVSSALGAFAAVKETRAAYPRALLHFQHYLQSAPYLYHPATDMLTYIDSSDGISYDDWGIEEPFFNIISGDYEVTISRQAPVAEFWITGDINAAEGGSVKHTIHSTRMVPEGTDLTIHIVYGGSPAFGNYSPVPAVQMLQGESEVSFTTLITDNTSIEGSRQVSVSIGVIDNSGNIFQAVAAIVPSIVTFTIHDNDTPTLLVQDKTVSESDSEVTLGVKLLKGTSSGFTVDYTTVGGTATAGADYVTTSGTLTYTGTLNEVHAITIPIISDLADDSGETFNIVLSNCSNGTVDINSEGTVTITDNSAENPPSATITSSEVLYLNDYTSTDSLVVKYYDNSTDPLGLDWHYWIYDLSLNLYPGLEPFADTSTNFELLPMAVIRRNKSNLPQYGTPEEINSVERLVKKLNLNLDELIDNINSSPDIAKIKDAYLNISVNPVDTGEHVAKLLYNLFYPVVAETPVISNQASYYLTVEQGDVQNAVVWSSQIFEPAIVGVIGSVGSFNHTVTGTSLAVRKQISGTQYDEIRIANLNGLATIKYQGHHEIAANVLGDESFTIPVSWYSLNLLSPKEQMDVYEKIVRLDFYAVEETEIAWYLTEEFMILFQVVLVVITIITAGAAAPATAGAATAASAAAATATSTILAIAQQIAINFLISQVVSAVAKATGNEALAAIVGIVAAIAFAPSGEGFAQLSNMVDAKSILNLSVDFASNLAESYTKSANEDTRQLSEDITEFNELAEKRLDELSDAVYDPAVTSDFLAMIRSVDTQSAPAIAGIYEFNVFYDYDRIVGDYHENLLQIGVI